MKKHCSTERTSPVHDIFGPLNAKKLKRPVVLDSRPWLVANVLEGPDVVEYCLISEAVSMQNAEYDLPYSLLFILHSSFKGRAV